MKKIITTLMMLSCFSASLIGCSSSDPEVCTVPDPDFPFLEITVPCPTKGEPPTKDTQAKLDNTNYCSSYLEGLYQPDEMTSPASQALAEAARICICFDACATDCAVWDVDNGAPQCEIGDPAYFSSLGGDTEACAVCKEQNCSNEINACVADGVL
jgi:hypothetical protein